MHTGSILPVAGGIIRRAQIDSVPRPKEYKTQLNGDMAHVSEEYKRNTDIAVSA